MKSNNSFPAEIWLEIISYIEPYNLVPLMRVSKEMKAMIEDANVYWGQFLKKAVYEAIQNETSPYENAKAAYQDINNIDLTKISISTLLAHPYRPNYKENRLKTLEKIQTAAPTIIASEVIGISIPLSLSRAIIASETIGINIPLSLSRAALSYCEREMSKHTLALFHSENAQITATRANLSSCDDEDLPSYDEIRTAELPAYDDAVVDNSSSYRSH